MSKAPLPEIRRLVHRLLEARGSAAEPADDDSLFFSGHLDSMAAVEIITVLESEFAVDFSALDFDVAIIDSISDIAKLAKQNQPI